MQFLLRNHGIKQNAIDSARNLLLDMDINNNTNNSTNLVTFQSLLEQRKINFIPMNYNDSWMRDVGPTFLITSDTDTNVNNDDINDSISISTNLCGMNWKFNAW
mgnify:CR=1 FL=1